MEALLVSGRIVDLVLGLVALEAIGLVIYQRRTGRGRGGLVNLLAGAALLLAVRAALAGDAWPWVGFWLAASLPPHLLDLRRRLRT